MNRNRLETVLYAAALALALALRLTALGRLSLSDGEARLALQALDLTRGQPVLLDPQPAYLSLTTLLIFLLGPLNWVARFWPALAGSLLVLAPALFKDRLGRLPALLLAFFFTLDPLFLAVSRQAGGQSLALSFVLLALGLWAARRPVLAGIAAGLALMSGPATWLGLLGLGLAWPLAFRVPGAPAAARTGNAPRAESAAPPLPLRGALIAALLVVLVIGTLFLALPGGLGAAAGGLAGFFGGWVRPGGASLAVMLLSLVSYGFFPLLFGLWGALSGVLRGRPVDVFFTIWALIALVLALAYPARQVTDLAWVLVPLWVLAARQVAALVTAPKYDRLPALGQALLVAVILGFAVLTAVTLVNVPQATPREEQQLIIRLAGAVLMLAASAGLIGWGWSREVALRGLTWGAGAVLLAFLLATAWNAGGLSGRLYREMWPSGPQPAEVDLLRQTVIEMDTWNAGGMGELDVVVVDQPSPALRWALRDRKTVRYVSRVPLDATPSLVITADQPDLGLAAAYRGQDFTLHETAIFPPADAAGWLRWLVFRAVPDDRVQRQLVVLWARGDLFPGGVAQP